MRAIGAAPVAVRYIGAQHVIGRYVGAQRVFIDYIRQGLIHQFDGKNNTGNGVYDPEAPTWTDLVTGTQATLENVSWQDFGVAFTNVASKVFYQGESVQEYTVLNTHKVSALQGLHPRLFGENPYPTLYLNSNEGYSYAFYGQGRDAYFSPRTSPPLNTIVQAALRFGGTGSVDFFYNGIFTSNLFVQSNPAPVSTMYLGCRAENDRVLTGEIYEHLVYNRPLSNAEIYHNFLVTKQRYEL